MATQSKSSKSKQAATKPVRSRAAAKPRVVAGAPKIHRGRPPKRVFINVLVRETTRAGLTRLKSAWSVASQGEVIDRLVAEAASAAPRKRGT